MTDRLALGVIPGTGWRARDIQMVARQAEDAGFDAIFTTEVNNDALATAQLMGTATQHIQVGTWVSRGRAKSLTLGPLTIMLGLPTFIGNDLETLRDAARQNLGLFTTFPFFQRLFRASGFAEEAAQMEQGKGASALTDRLLDAVCLLGAEVRCSDQLAAFRAADVDMPILLPPAGAEGTRAVIQAFRR